MDTPWIDTEDSLNDDQRWKFIRWDRIHLRGRISLQSLFLLSVQLLDILSQKLDENDTIL